MLFSLVSEVFAALFCCKVAGIFVAILFIYKDSIYTKSSADRYKRSKESQVHSSAMLCSQRFLLSSSHLLIPASDLQQFQQSVLFVGTAQSQAIKPSNNSE